MRKYMLIALLMLLTIPLWSQSETVPSVSNYHLTWTTINPAFTGYQDALSLSSFYRTALYGDFGPRDMTVNVHSPLGKTKTSVGGSIALNSIPGMQNGYSIQGNYAYRIELRQGRIALGLSAGMFGLTNDVSNRSLRDPDDPYFPDERYNFWYPNFGAGILYHNKGMFVGLSVPELLTVPDETQGIGKFSPKDYRVIFTAAYTLMEEKAVQLKPTIWIDYSRADTWFKASLTAAMFQSKVYLGAAYSHPNFVAALVNYQINEQFLLGYAYSFNVGQVSNALGIGSHEIVLRWEWRPVTNSIPNDPFYF